MIVFQVNDMTCGHCVATITKVVKAADPSAQVRIELDRHLVMIEPGITDAKKLEAVIQEAGYTPARQS